ncbi:MAG: hypothetical protein JST48_05345 [Bacteroidetes bacterium]|nr:hypothetical protein [Bacteroidota bacterium]
MKRLIIRSYSICIFLCAPFFTKAQELRLADSLFARGEYLHARVEYERLLYKSTPNSNLILLKKSYCLKAEQKFENAYSTLQRADFFQGSDSLKFKLYYESILDAYLAAKYDLSLSKIQEIHYYLPEANSQLIDLIEILALNQQQKLAEAEKAFIAYQTKYKVTAAINPFQKKKYKKLKKPEKAESISHLLPGVGQMYAGYFGRGLTSAVIQSGAVAFAVFSFLNGYYFSGAFTGVGLFYMFNNGGARHAKYLAEKKNGELIKNLNNEIKNIFEQTLK